MGASLTSHMSGATKYVGCAIGPVCAVESPSGASRRPASRVAAHCVGSAPHGFTAPCQHAGEALL